MKLNLHKKITSLLFTSFLLSTAALAGITDPEPEIAEADTTFPFEKIYLDRITVVGAPVWQSRIPGAASYISAEQLRTHSYSDVNRILRSVSGINIQEEDGYGLRPNIGLRGAGVERSTKVNIMEDGILVAPAPYSAPAAYYFPNMARINSVEIRKGSSQIKYGPNTTGGAINMISTPIPTEFSASAELSYGERNANKIYATVGDRSERFGYMFEVLQIGDDGFKQLDGLGDTGFILRDISGKLMYQTSNEASVYQRVELKAGLHTEISDETYLGLSRADFESNPLRRYASSQEDQMDVEQSQFTLRHFALFSENIDLTTTLYRQDVTRAWYKLHQLNGSLPGVNTTNLGAILRDPEANATEYSYLSGAANSPDNALIVRNNNREYFSHGIQSILGFNFDTGAANNQLEIGVRLHQDEEDRFQFEDGYRMLDGQMVLTNQGVPGTQANRVGSATALSVYIQDEITWNRFTVTPGLRYEHIWFTNRNYGSQDLDRTGSNLNENEYTVDLFIPGIGATFSATENLTFITGVHRGFSPPSPGSSPDTRPELSVNYELGARFANSPVQTELIGFFNNYSNLLGSDLAAGGGAGTTAQFNAGEVEVYGIEFTVNADLATLFDTGSVSLPFSTNYTFTSATFQNDFDSSFGPWGTVTKGDEIPFIPRHQLNSSFGFLYNNYSLNLNTVYSPQMRTRAGSGAIEQDFSTDSYVLVDINTGYSINSNIDLFVNVRNLFDNHYIVSDRPHGVRPGLPRTFTGGLKVQF